MIPFDEWPDERMSSAAEYSMIHELASDLIESNRGDPELPGMLKGMLTETLGWALYLLGDDAPTVDLVHAIQNEIDASGQDSYEGNKEMEGWTLTDAKILGMQFAQDMIRQRFNIKESEKP